MVDVFGNLHVVAGLLGGGVLLGYMFFAEQGVSRYLHVRETAAELKQRIHAIHAGNQQLEEEIRRIETDEQKLEELARNRLGMVRDGETVYQFVPAQGR